MVTRHKETGYLHWNRELVGRKQNNSTEPVLTPVENCFASYWPNKPSFEGSYNSEVAFTEHPNRKDICSKPGTYSFFESVQEESAVLGIIFGANN